MAQMNVDQAMDGFLRFQESMNLSKSTIKNTRSVLRPFVAHCGPARRLSNITSTTITEFFMKQSETRSGGSMVHTHDRLSAFFKWCVDSGYLKPHVNPMRGRRPPKYVKRERNRLHFAKFPHLLDLAGEQSPRDRAMCAMALYTLMRDQEMATLRVRDVSLDAGYISITVHKANKVDRMPICAELDAELRTWFVEYQKVCGPLQGHWYLLPFLIKDQGRSHRGRLGEATFVGYDPEKVLGQCGRFVAPLLGAVGMPLRDSDGRSLREGAHTLRRSGARGLYDVLVASGRVDALRIVQTMLHHADVQQTQHYIGLDPDKEVRDSIIRGVALYGFDSIAKLGADHSGTQTRNDFSGDVRSVHGARRTNLFDHTA